MAPKFKGDSEDWLDDEDGARQRGARPKKSNVARSLGLPPEEANAVVAEVFPNQCRVRLDENQQDLLCNYRRAGVVSKSKTEARERTPVAVGDRVLIKHTGESSGIVEGICTRKNRLCRPAPGRDSESLHHVLAANVDLLVIVASAGEPHFSPGLVDRFMIAAEAEGIAVLLCVSKIDLGEPGEKPWDLYRRLGYSVVEVSSKQGLGIPQIQEQIQGKVVVFCGQSGVGKTSLLRVLLGVDVGRVGKVNESTGKGRHTTTGAVLLEGPGQSQWIDTPGVREFGLVGVSPESLADHFPELRDLSCKITNCLHIDEEGCLAQGLPRYSSYRRIFDSLVAGEN